MSNRFTQYILMAMALGIVMGTLVFNYLLDIRADIAADVNLIAMLFLRPNRDLIPLYNKWFVSRLPTGEKLNVAISPQLEEAFKVLNDTEGTSN